MASKPVVSKKQRKRVYPATLPEVGYLRLPQIIGDPKSEPPTPALIPVGKTTWWEGVRSGRFPAGLKIGAKTTVWSVQSIMALLERLAARGC